MSSKLWKFRDSRQNYCNNNQQRTFWPPCRP